jgi:putative DNA primase/helicase
VDGGNLLADIVSAVHRHVKISDCAAIAVALWCIHAHAFEASTISPRLAITSPEKRCGKTTLLNVVGKLVPKPLSAANITSAALFRTVEACCPTLLIDEADTFLSESEELRGVINSGHQRNGQVVRLVGEDHEPRAFATCCPTAIAAIGTLPGTIEDRSVSVALRRRKNDESVVRFRLDRSAHLEELSRKAARWAADNLAKLGDADPELLEQLHDRAQDNWRPLLAIADLVGGAWPDRARRASLELSAANAEEADTLSTQLLADIRVLFRAQDGDKLFTESLLLGLARMDDRPWSTFDRSRPISSASVARLLKAFGIRPGTIRDGNRTAKGYAVASFEDAFERYLPLEGVTASQS